MQHPARIIYKIYVSRCRCRGKGTEGERWSGKHECCADSAFNKLPTQGLQLRARIMMMFAEAYGQEPELVFVR